MKLQCGCAFNKPLSARQKQIRLISEEAELQVKHLNRCIFAACNAQTSLLSTEKPAILCGFIFHEITELVRLAGCKASHTEFVLCLGHDRSFSSNFFMSRVMAKNALVTTFYRIFGRDITKSFHYTLCKLSKYKSISVSSPNLLHNNKNHVRSIVDYYWLACMNIINPRRQLWKPRFQAGNQLPR